MANDVVEIVYTPSYLGAAPLMQLYLLGQMTMVLAAGHLLVLLNAGQLATTISAVCLTLSVALSLAGIHWIGLVGAVAGSVISLVVGEVRALMVVTRRLETTVLGVIHRRVTGRALGVIAAAMMGALLARKFGLDGLYVGVRLAATLATFSVIVVAGAFATGLNRRLIPLLTGLSRGA